MERTDQKHLLLLITNPFAVINVIHSGLIRELGKHYRISVMSDLLTNADIGHFNKHFQLNMHWLPIPVPSISSFAKWLRTVQMLLFGHFFNIETIRIKVMERSPVLYLLYCISQKINFLTFVTGTLMIAIRNWLIRRTTMQDVYASVAGYNFHAVFSTSPLDLRENTVANSLRTHGITCISMVISWDNLTSKGVINAKSDVVLVWNRTMALEYQRLYAVFGDDTAARITGIPRFDIYFHGQPKPGLNADRLPGFNRQTRLILFSTGAVKHHACQNYIIRDLLEYAESRTDIQILVRCHPDDTLARYHCFSGVRNLWFFQPFGENANRVPPTDFLETLYWQLDSCRVCLQIASTMLLDAGASGKPCISIAYDHHSDTHYNTSVKRFYDYTHQQSLPIRLKANMVFNRQELFAQLDKILTDNDSSRGLRTAVEPVIHHCTPDSVRLTTQYIRECLD